MAIGTPLEMIANSATAVSPWTPTTKPAAQPAGSMLVLMCSGGSGLLLSSVADTPGNTWVVLTGVSDGTRTANFAYALNSKAFNGSTDTITLTWSTTTSMAKTLSMYSITGMPTSGAPQDVSVTNTGTTTPTVGPTATLGQTVEIAWALFRANALTTYTTDWTATTTQKIGAAGWGYKIANATTALTTTPTTTGVTNYVGQIYTFRAAVVPGMDEIVQAGGRRGMSQAVKRSAFFMSGLKQRRSGLWAPEPGIMVPQYRLKGA